LTDVVIEGRTGGVASISGRERRRFGTDRKCSRFKLRTGMEVPAQLHSVGLSAKPRDEGLNHDERSE